MPEKQEQLIKDIFDRCSDFLESSESSLEEHDFVINIIISSIRTLYRTQNPISIKSLSNFLEYSPDSIDILKSLLSSKNNTMENASIVSFLLDGYFLNIENYKIGENIRKFLAKESQTN